MLLKVSLENIRDRSYSAAWFNVWTIIKAHIRSARELGQWIKDSELFT